MTDFAPPKTLTESRARKEALLTQRRAIDHELARLKTWAKDEYTRLAKSMQLTGTAPLIRAAIKLLEQFEDRGVDLGEYGAGVLASMRLFNQRGREDVPQSSGQQPEVKHEGVRSVGPAEAGGNVALPDPRGAE